MAMVAEACRADPPPQTSRSYPRILGRAQGAKTGPTLVCVAALHGNEPAGVEGLCQVLRSLETQPLRRGRLIGFVGNRAALSQDRRYLVEDLNRIWTDQRLAAVRARGEGAHSDEQELLELDRELQSVLVDPRPAFLLDLHTTSGPGPAFVVLEDTLANRRLGLALPAPLVLGIEEEVEGTLAHHLVKMGVAGVTFEAGQHRDPEAGDRAACALWIALETLGLLSSGDPRATEARQRLEAERRALPTVVDVRYRHEIGRGDDFRMRPGFKSFQPIEREQVLADDVRGPIQAQQSGFILMPLYQAQGDDGFFVVRKVRPMWLRLSGWLRRIHAERFVHLLPGVERVDPGLEVFTVDRQVARLWALEIFHLLGFRRRGPLDRKVTMVRRNDG